MTFLRSFSKASAALLLTLLAASPALQAQTSQPPVFASVAELAGGAGGAGAYGSLTQDAAGNFYGTTYLGGTSGAGTVFRASASGTITVVHSFTGDDGRYPQGGLILASDGFIYGTTYSGGSGGAGTIFRVLPSSGAFERLYDFDGKYGANPYAGLVEIDNLLYGTTVTSGPSGAGTLFSFPLGALTGGSPANNPPRLLANFTGGSDGGNPEAAPISGGDGSLYGTTATGGDFQGGTVYRYTPGEGLTTLHAFSLGEPTGPAASLVLADSGSFYGTTVSGGAANAGAIFSITADGTLTTVYNFSGGTDGATPQGALVEGADGTFYGTAAAGGVLDSGTVFSLSPAGILTVLQVFDGDSRGGTPESGLFLASDGFLYGTTYAGGNGTANFGNGTVYRLLFIGAPGAVQFTNPTYSTIESIGTANLTVSRVNGSAGAVSVDYATSNGTATAGIDYTAAAGTLTWADGDTADKTIAVPVTDRGLTDGSTRTVGLALMNLRGGATAGQTLTAVLSIVDNDAQPIQPTITITSPPADIQVVTGAPLTLAASVTDPDTILARVQFFLNGQLYQETTSAGPFSLTTPAPAPGTYTLKATAIDNLGRQSSSTRTLTVLAVSDTAPAPTARILTDLNGRRLAAGTTIVLTASAESLDLNGEALAGVDFYADSTLIASLDGLGNPETDSAGRPVRRPAVKRRVNDTTTPTPTIFQTNFTVPNLDKLVNLLTVANAQSGRSQVSSSVTIKATTSTDNKPPQAALQDVTNGAQVNLGATLTVPVAVSDPDALSAIPAARRPGGAPHPQGFTPPAGVISQVAYYLDQLKIATSSAPPFTFNVTPTTSGMHVIEAIVTDGGGLSNAAAPVIINVVAPVVSLSVGGTNRGTATEGGAARRVQVKRVGDTSQALTVNYKVKGPNVAGVDYAALSGTVTIPAGATRAKIKVRALNDGVADGDKLLKIQLTPPTDGSYTLGAPKQVKIRIIDAQ